MMMQIQVYEYIRITKRSKTLRSMKMPMTQTVNAEDGKIVLSQNWCQKS